MGHGLAMLPRQVEVSVIAWEPPPDEDRQTPPPDGSLRGEAAQPETLRGGF